MSEQKIKRDFMTNAEKCYETCHDYACVRAGHCTGAGKWEDEELMSEQPRAGLAHRGTRKVLPRCEGCGCEYDPDYCHCGESIEGHGLDHTPVPVGCVCGYASSSEIVCPFCEGPVFDRIGLKHHLNAGHCDHFNAVKVL